MVVSDNAKPFLSVSKWNEEIRKKPDINTWCRKLSSHWTFSIPRSPFWNGYFERIVGLNKKRFVCDYGTNY